MKKTIAVIGVALVVGVVCAGDLFTDITSHYPPDIARQANAALDALEDAIGGAPASVTVTNGGVLSITRGLMLVTPTDVATVTVANPSSVGQFATIVNVGTNNVTVAKATNLALGGATRALTPHGTLSLVSSATNAWKEVSNSIGNEIE